MTCTFIPLYSWTAQSALLAPIYTHQDVDLGFSVLPKDTSTHGNQTSIAIPLPHSHAHIAISKCNLPILKAAHVPPPPCFNLSCCSWEEKVLARAPTVFLAAFKTTFGKNLA